MIIKQISVFVENRSGRMAEITRDISEGGVNIRALSVADTDNYGVLRFIADDPVKAEKVLRDSGMTVTLTDVLGVGIDDTPGGLSKVLTELADHSIQVEYMYAFISKKENRAGVVLRVENAEEAAKLLTEKGWKGLSED
ncbi:MAG: ACT domain-containing protein [Firmicutes bacterium]|nr:ACT domain-containing protein [Bacillota bacterium]